MLHDVRPIEHGRSWLQQAQVQRKLGGRNHTKQDVKFWGLRLRKYITIKFVHYDRNIVYANDGADADDERVMMNDE